MDNIDQIEMIRTKVIKVQIIRTKNDFFQKRKRKTKGKPLEPNAISRGFVALHTNMNPMAFAFIYLLNSF